MIISTKKGTPKDELEKIVDKFEKQGLDVTLITGVVVARADFVKEHPAAVSDFLEQYSASVDWVNANTAEAAELIGGVKPW